jgi:hypothetical protein
MASYVHPADQLSNFGIKEDKECAVLDVLDQITDP